MRALGKVGLTGSVLVLAVSAACSTATDPAERTTMHSVVDCSAESVPTRLRAQVELVPGTVVVEGLLTADEKAELAATVGGGHSVASSYTLTVTRTVVGEVENPATVWLPAGSTPTTVTSGDGDVFTAGDGRGVFVLTPEALQGRTTAVQGFPVVDDRVVLGYGCAHAEEFPQATAALPGGLSVRAPGPSNTLEPVDPTTARGPVVTVALPDFVAALDL